MVSKEVLVVAAPWQGHTTPAAQLSQWLSSKFRVHLLLTPYPGVRLPTVGKDIVVHVLPMFLDTELQQMTLMETHLALFPKLLHGREDLVDRALDLIPVRPSVIIHDTWAVWGLSLARRLGVTAISFFPSPLLYATLQRFQHNGFDSRIDELDVPGFGVVEKGDFHQPVQVESIRSFLDDATYHMSESDLMLVNDHPALYPDSRQLKDALADQLGWSESNRIHEVGFLLQEVPSTKEVDEPLAWLYSQSFRSTIFVAMGTVFDLPEHNLTVLAQALEACGRPVLWAYRQSREPDKQHLTEIPLSVSARSNGRVKVVPFVNQIEVLGHPSLAMFITHCGWNSVSEAITLAGLPLLCIPCGADQPTVASLVCKLGIGLRGCREALSDHFVLDDLLANMHTLLDNDSYRIRAEQISHAIRDKQHCHQAIEDIATRIRH